MNYPPLVGVLPALSRCRWNQWSKGNSGCAIPIVTVPHAVWNFELSLKG